MLLYDERGLRLYDDITTEVPEYYYLFRAEEEILKTNADDIVQTMLHGANVTRRNRRGSDLVRGKCNNGS